MSPIQAAPSPEQRLVSRITFGAAPAELARVAALGSQRYLEEQLAPEALDDGGLEARLARDLPTLAATPAELFRVYGEKRPVRELLVATIARSLASPRQLLERMVHVWTDHFNVDLFDDTGYFLKPVDDREVVRRHALGTFPALLMASAKSPAMIVYLSNHTNRKGHPNQNYARELLELHTLGVDNGYTQHDVEEVARCFTGWSVWGGDGGDRLGRFRFDPDAHDTGRKVVLGHVIKAGGGIEDGEAVLGILARHPGTAHFVAGKLLAAFWGPAPPPRFVDVVAGVYRATGGDIKKMLRAVLKRSFLATAPPKLKRPYHFMISALRALAAEVVDPSWLLDALTGAGHLPFAWAAPDGYPDTREYWSSCLLPRWSFAAALADEATSGVRLDLSWLDPALLPVNLARAIDARLSNGAFSEATRTALRDFLRGGPKTPERLGEALGLALASPEFQEY